MDDEQKLKHFAELLWVYFQHTRDDRHGIALMAKIVNDPHATEEERTSALNTMREGLFPTIPVDLTDLPGHLGRIGGLM